jgi:hypothetical protein
MRGSRTRWAIVGAAAAMMFGAAGLARAGSVETSSSGYTAISPVRVVDTRVGLGAATAPVGPGTTTFGPWTSPGPVPPDATGVMLNVTELNGSEQSFLTVYPTTSPADIPPVASDLNWSDGSIHANQIAVALNSPEQSIDVFNAAGSVDVLVDLVGYFTEGVGIPGPAAMSHLYVASSNTASVVGPTAPAGSYLVEIAYSGVSPLSCTVTLGDGTPDQTIADANIPSGTTLTVGATPGFIGAIKTAITHDLKYGVTYAAVSNASLDCAGAGGTASLVMTAIDALN